VLLIEVFGIVYSFIDSGSRVVFGRGRGREGLEVRGWGLGNFFH
jgi:hypothetical protein